jgi:hypothetical protein
MFASWNQNWVSAKLGIDDPIVQSPFGEMSSLRGMGRHSARRPFRIRLLLQ